MAPFLYKKPRGCSLTVLVRPLASPGPKGSIDDECTASEWLATSLVIIRTAALLTTFSKKKAGAFAALGVLTYISEAQNDIFLKSF